MAKRGENIYHRKDGRWEGRYISGRRPNGKAIFTSIYGRRYQDVRRRLIEQKSSCTLLQFAAPALCFAGRAEYYLEQKARPFVKPSTYAHYRQIVEQHLNPVFGAVPLTSLTAESIQCYFSGASAHLASGTLRNIFNLLRSILKDAYLDGRIPQRIWENVRLPSVKRTSVRILTREEQKHLEKIALQSDRLEFILCLYTGVRIGELCALQWRDIDWAASSLTIAKSLHRIGPQTAIGPTKTENSCRIVPLPGFLAELLSARREACHAADDDYLFPGRKRSYCDIRTVQARMRKIARQAGLENIHVHTLRHTYATRLLEQDVGIETVSSLLGHASPTITLRYYAHCTAEHRHESACALQLLSQ